VVLHISPEAAIGGPLAIVKDGDRIKLDVENNRLELLISESEIASRLKSHTKSSSLPNTSWGSIFKATVLQASEGADIDTTGLRGTR